MAHRIKGVIGMVGVIIYLMAAMTSAPAKAVVNAAPSNIQTVMNACHTLNICK